MNKLRIMEPNHVFREQNQVAGSLVKESPKKDDFCNTIFFVVPPIFVVKTTKSRHFDN